MKTQHPGKKPSQCTANAKHLFAAVEGGWAQATCLATGEIREIFVDVLCIEDRIPKKITFKMIVS